MALTAQQRADIRTFCGWSARFLQTDSALERAMNAIDGVTEVETQVTTLVTKCKDIETRVTAALDNLDAVKVGSIELNGAQIGQLRREGRRYASQICAILGVEKRHDVFSASGPDTRAGFFGPYGGSGNFVGK